MSPPRGILLSLKQDDDHVEPLMAADIRQSTGRADREKYISITGMFYPLHIYVEKLHSIYYIYIN